MSSSDLPSSPQLAAVGPAEISVPRTTLGERVWTLVSSRIGLSLFVGVVALAVRWPYLVQVPRLTDEVWDIEWALQIARGEILPLISTNNYLGPLHPYLLAALYRLFGENVVVARGMMAVLGAVLAGLVAWLAWGMARRSRSVAALAAGALTTTSFTLVIVNSHQVWSMALAPLGVIAALGVTWAAIERKRPGWLVLAGLAWGLALQLHPLAITFLPGALVWAIGQPIGRFWLRTRWPWLAVAAFLVGYSNMIWFTLTSQGASVQEATAPTHNFFVIDSLADYGSRMTAVVVQMARMFVGAYVPPDGQHTTVGDSPFLLLYLIVPVIALAWSLRRRSTAILPLAAVSGACLVAVASGSFDLQRTWAAVYDARYLSPLLPLIYIAVGLLAADVWSRWSAPASRLPIAAVAAALVLIPLFAIQSYYARSEAGGLTNEGFYVIAAAAREEAARGGFVLLDKDSDNIKLGGRGDAWNALHALMWLDGVPHTTVKLDKMRYYLTYSEDPMTLILTDKAYQALASDFSLTPLNITFLGLSVYTAPAAH